MCRLGKSVSAVLVKDIRSAVARVCLKHGVVSQAGIRKAYRKALRPPFRKMAIAGYKATDANGFHINAISRDLGI